MIASAYIRVSSKAQHFDLQRLSIERAAAERGDQIGEWYSEKRSAKTLARLELDRLRADVRTGKVKRVFVFKLDRLTRTGVGDTYKIIDEFKAGACELVAVADLSTGAEGGVVSVAAVTVTVAVLVTLPALLVAVNV